MEKRNGNNSHYSEQSGHALRGEFFRIQKQVYRFSPDQGVSRGVIGMSAEMTYIARRSMQRSPRSGKVR